MLFPLFVDAIITSLSTVQSIMSIWSLTSSNHWPFLLVWLPRSLTSSNHWPPHITDPPVISDHSRALTFPDHWHLLTTDLRWPLASPDHLIQLISPAHWCPLTTDLLWRMTSSDHWSPPITDLIWQLAFSHHWPSFDQWSPQILLIDNRFNLIVTSQITDLPWPLTSSDHWSPLITDLIWPLASSHFWPSFDQ